MRNRFLLITTLFSIVSSGAVSVNAQTNLQDLSQPEVSQGFKQPEVERDSMPGILPEMTEETDSREIKPAESAVLQEKPEHEPHTSRINGTVLDARTARVNDLEEEHLLAKVRIDSGKDSGRTVVLDLGPVDTLQQQNLDLSDLKNITIAASGVQGQINEKPALIVQRFDTGEYGAEVQAQRDVPGSDARARIDQRTTVEPLLIRAFHGQIADMRTARVKPKNGGSSEEHQFLKLRSPDGSEHLVDLGRVTSEGVRTMSLQQGDNIMVTGPSGTVDEIPVLFATDISQFQKDVSEMEKDNFR